MKTKKSLERFSNARMYKHLKILLSLITLIAAGLTAMALISCSSDDSSTNPDPIPNQDPSATVNGTINFGTADVFNQVRNKDGNLPLQDDELLYAANTYQPPLGFLKPIKAPDGHTLTLSEFKKAKGTITVKCNGNGAMVDIVLEGLIPNGTYTVWLAYLKVKKKVGESIQGNDWVYSIKPPLGPPTGTENVLNAGADGTINVTKVHSSCILTDEVALVIPVIYHLNGKTFGGGEIPDVEQVAHLLFYFQ